MPELQDFLVKFLIWSPLVMVPVAFLLWLFWSFIAHTEDETMRKRAVTKKYQMMLSALFLTPQLCLFSMFLADETMCSGSTTRF